MEYIIGMAAGAAIVCIGFFIARRFGAEKTTEQVASETYKRQIEQMEQMEQRRQEQWENLLSYTGKPQTGGHEG